MEVKRVEWLRRFRVSLIIPFILVLFPFFAFAGGGQHYPNGAEAMLIGVAPPPGFYLKNYFYFYTANKLKDNSGDTMSLSSHGVGLDRLNVYGFIPRLIWISKLNFLGGFYGQHLFVPLLNVDMDLNVLTPGGPINLNEKRSGIGT